MADSALPDDLLAVLDRSVDSHRAFIPASRRPFVKQLCAEAVAFGPTLPGDVAARARAAAQLLLAIGYPRLDASIRDDLADICSLAALTLV